MIMASYRLWEEEEYQQCCTCEYAQSQQQNERLVLANARKFSVQCFLFQLLLVQQVFPFCWHPDQWQCSSRIILTNHSRAIRWHRSTPPSIQRSAWLCTNPHRNHTSVCGRSFHYRILHLTPPKDLFMSFTVFFFFLCSVFFMLLSLTLQQEAERSDLLGASLLVSGQVPARHRESVICQMHYKDRFVVHKIFHDTSCCHYMSLLIQKLLRPVLKAVK